MGDDVNEEISDNISNYNNPDTENNDNINTADDENNNNIDTANDDISIEGESPNDTYVTINDINIVREMNNTQLNNDLKQRKKETGRQ